MSEVTASSQRVFHRTQNTFNRIQNSFVTIEIHDQGYFRKIISVLLSCLIIRTLTAKTRPENILGNSFDRFGCIR